MSAAASARAELLEQLARELPTVSATRLVAGMQKVTSAVMAEGAVVVTRHDQPSMVLMSIDRYLKLRQAAEPDLDHLTRRFDDMFARMQEPGMSEAMEAAFDSSPQELGDAAVRAAAREAEREPEQAAKHGGAGG
jgi:PHD/YefM family antitoxin component YafN of YafNO toxin-antitoxin module